MTEFLNACIMPLNLPFTIVLVLVLLYWLTVILGALDMDFLDFNLDFETDSGFLSPLLQMLAIGEVPVSLIMSILSGCGWWFAMMSNYMLNPGESVIIGLLLLIPNLCFTFFMAAVLLRPLRRIFGPLHQQAKGGSQILDKVGEVISGQVNSSWGQVEIDCRGSSLRINARTRDGLILNKGSRVLIYDYDLDRDFYYVELFME